MEFYIIAVIVGIGFGLYIVWDMFIKKTKEFILVEYSEKIGEVIIQHPKFYKGFTSKDGKSIKIEGLKDSEGKRLTRPFPQNEYMLPNIGKNKMVSIIKIGIDRYAYRIPSLHNEVFTYKYDEKGYIVKENEKPLIIKKAWTFCDDVVEPNTKHWGQLIRKELEEKHRKKDALSAWKPYIVFGAIFVFAIIALKFVHDSYITHVEILAGKIEKTQNQADQIIASLNNFLGSNKKATDQPPAPP